MSRRQRSIIRQGLSALALSSAITATLGASSLFADTTSTYIGPAGGTWNNAANWSNVPAGSFVPNNGNGGVNYVVIIDNNTSQNSTVTTNASFAVDGVTIAGGDALAISNSTTFTLVSGTINNAGVVSVASTGGFTDFFASGSVTLTGGGSFTLQNADRIRGTGTSPTLINVNNVIQGETSNSGNLGNGELAIVNQSAGIIDANVTGLILLVDPNVAGLINQGILRATKGGILELNGNAGGTINNTGGTILANGTSSQVQFISNTSISGGTLTTTNGGTIHNVNTAVLTNITNTGLLIFNNASTTYLVGTITNTASIDVGSSGGFTDLYASGTVTLTGGGTVTLSLADRVRANGTGGQLINVNNLIQGETGGGGSIGNGDLTVVNQASGVIDANVNAAALILDPGAGGLTNTGIMRATNGGILQLTGVAGGAFTNTGGTILANGSTSQVQFLSNASIIGGTLTTSNGGTIHNVNTGVLTNITNTGSLVLNNGSTTTIVGTFTNTASTNLGSTGTFTDLLVSGTVSLTGSGSVSLSSADRIRATATTSQFINVNNLIHGETGGGGSIGNGDLTVVNQASGVIDANVNAAALILDPGAGGLTNTGIMRATNGGILQLTGAGGGAFTNTGGTILANGTSSQVLLVASASITGGTLTTSNGGVIHNINAASLTSLTSAGNLILDNGSTTNIVGTFTNTGATTVNSVGSFTDFSISGTVTLTGGGTVTLSNADRIRGGSGTANQLINVNNLIRGETNNSGSIGNNEISVINQSAGIIKASTTGLALVIDPANNATGLTNQGLMTATNGGILYLTGSGGGSFTNTGGSITATGAGSKITVRDSALISGGILSSSAGATIENPNTASLDNLTLAATFNADNGTNTFLSRTITNTGTISINSSGSFTDVYISGTVTLTGGGSVTLANADRIRANGTGSTLINVNNIIQGETNNSGAIGNNDVAINNAGVIIANSTTGLTMFIDPVDTGIGFTSTGSLTANGAPLTMQNATYALSGTIQAINGGVLTFNAGTYNITSPVTFANNSTVNFNGASISALSISGTGALNVGNGGHLTSDAVSVIGSWNINGVHTLRLGDGNAGTTKVAAVPIVSTSTGQLDLTDNKLIVQATDATDKNTKINALNTEISAGANGTLWNGHGITSSLAATDSTHLGVGVFDNAILGKTSFGGQSVDTNSILTAIAHLGDANRNGIVDIQDLTIVANNWQQPRNNWAQGNLNRDGVVDIQDFTIVANNWQQTSSYSQDVSLISAFTAAAPVPEPASLSLLALSGLLLLHKPRSRRPS